MKKKDLAISPVVGVMLTLVITVITGGVVAGIAVGVCEDTTDKLTPRATVSSSFVDDKLFIRFSECSEFFSPDDLKIVLSYASSDGLATQEISYDDYISTGSKLLTEVNLTSETKMEKLTYVTNETLYNSKYSRNKEGRLIGSISFTFIGGITSNETEDSMSNATLDLNVIQGNKIKLIESGESLNLEIIYVPTGTTIYKKDMIYSYVK